MGILIDRYSSNYINKLSQPAQERKAAPRARGEGKFDEVLISAGGRQTDEKRITEGLSQRVMSQVRTPASKERIDALEKAVEGGQYRVNADSAAGRILLAEGEGTDE